MLTGILNRWGYPPECRPLEKGRAKGAGWINGICTYPLLRSSRLFEADPSPGLWPSPFSKGELADRYSQRVSPSRPVISSGVSMLHEDTVKNRYSFDESRNLSCTREYRAFQLAQLRCSKCTPSAFGISSYGKATHDDLSVASLLQIMFAATPEGEPRNLRLSSSRHKAKGSMLPYVCMLT